MNDILDLDEHSPKKSSWKPVLIVNGILAFIGLYYFARFLFADSVQIGLLGKNQVLVPILFITAFSIFTVNIVLGLVSYIFSNVHTKKWLTVAGYAFILSVCTLILSIIILYH